MASEMNRHQLIYNGNTCTQTTSTNFQPKVKHADLNSNLLMTTSVVNKLFRTRMGSDVQNIRTPDLPPLVNWSSSNLAIACARSAP